MRAAKAIALWLLILAAVLPQLALAEIASRPPEQVPLAQAQSALSIQPSRRANFKDEQVSEAARAAANWIIDSGDNLGMPFMLVDKQRAQVLMFDANGQLSGTSSALLGLAVGDDSTPGIGERPLSSIRPEERTTPAGRFVASLGRNIHGKEILWVDYEGALSLHPVVTSNPRERRAERLASANIHDKRISYGCINVPAEFFTAVVAETFKNTDGVVYVLPETRPNHAVFASYYEVE
ncbi:MAG: hypothetical protein M0Q95_06855 [Porticoccaceae bacterium]|nr:hypothetical protein [Porticoccaceae bacterium]